MAGCCTGVGVAVGIAVGIGVPLGGGGGGGDTGQHVVLVTLPQLHCSLTQPAPHDLASYPEPQLGSQDAGGPTTSSHVPTLQPDVQLQEA